MSRHDRRRQAAIERCPPTLPPRFEAAYRKLLENPPPEPDDMPRDLRIGFDYAVQAGWGVNVQTDALWSWKFTCWNRRDRAKGDPEATVDGWNTAHATGEDHGTAFALLGQLRDSTAILAEHGHDAEALPQATMRVLQQAAHGEPVPADQLSAVLDAARELHGRIGPTAFDLLRSR